MYRSPILAFITIVSAHCLCAEDRFEQKPIEYSLTKAENPVSRLQTKLKKGELKWTPENKTGFLKPLLQGLGIGLNSQTLVFSKTSFQAKRISPSYPRALYFNDEVYVGYVPGSHLLELSVADPKLGAVFYVFDQRDKSLNRETSDCLSCHGSSRTNYAPGHFLRSVVPAEDGHSILWGGSKLVSHSTPYHERWGGWYASERIPQVENQANSFGEIINDREIKMNKSNDGQSISKLFNSEFYLSPHSDIVALMVQDHQVTMHNLIAQANYKTRQALFDQKIIDQALGRNSAEMSSSTKSRIANIGEKLLKYLLFVEEAELPSCVYGSTDFAENFSNRGPHDSKGRSLYQLDLKKRLLKYPCSYLIHSCAFKELPSETKDYLYKRLWEILNGKDQNEPFSKIKMSDLQAIKEILLDTQKDLPKYWVQKT